MAEGRVRQRHGARAKALSVVDASVWVSALVAGETDHAASRAWLERRAHASQLVVGPSLLLPEVAAAISRRTGRPRLGHRAVSALLRWPGLRIVAIDEELAEKAARLAADLRLRGADAVYVAVACRIEVPLVTWDREQLERGTRVVSVMEPVAGE